VKLLLPEICRGISDRAQEAHMRNRRSARIGEDFAAAETAESMALPGSQLFLREGFPYSQRFGAAAESSSCRGPRVDRWPLPSRFPVQPNRGLALPCEGKGRRLLLAALSSASVVILVAES